MTIFLTVLLSIVGSLLFSEVLGWTPCKLCWYQRILMYPQIVIVLIGKFLKDKRVFFYHLYLSLVGFIFSLFHYLIQKEVIKGVDCNLVSSSTTCLFKINFIFGYISIPFMAATAFLMIILVSIINLSQILKK